MTSTSFTAACVQMRSTRDQAQNRDDAIRMIREAATAGALFVQTPEMTNLVERSTTRLREVVEAEDRHIVLAGLREAARERKIWLHIGSLSVKVGEKVANRAYMIDPKGQIAARYDKIHLFDVDLPNGEKWRESATYTGGESAAVVETPWGLVGLSICYDIRFPYLYRAEAEAGAVMLTAPACFTRQTGEAHWQVLQRARAIENGAFMISAAQAGTHEDGRETYGHSIIVDPWGRVLAEAQAEPGVILAEIDLALVADARQRIPTMQHTKPTPVTAYRAEKSRLDAAE
ncbi:carbon-nitrogen hydrolase family protein [Bosea sp. BK604]|uniref:carbon-nitrogen hydrolase family protein n=1 Tax=Bosea sp. BK604 TaxID=2512180 RepID=UPI001043CE60|nr:carbon-nitrogen hydrolase family protein [Bosea sp. BK604]TCR70330.1 putative amidohydrolase [Bosea sp. BK604]